jgi:hypothetical protein
MAICRAADHHRLASDVSRQALEMNERQESIHTLADLPRAYTVGIAIEHQWHAPDHDVSTWKSAPGRASNLGSEFALPQRKRRNVNDR